MTKITMVWGVEEEAHEYESNLLIKNQQFYKMLTGCNPKKIIYRGIVKDLIWPEIFMSEVENETQTHQYGFSGQVKTTNN